MEEETKGYQNRVVLIPFFHLPDCQNTKNYINFAENSFTFSEKNVKLVNIDRRNGEFASARRVEVLLYCSNAERCGVPI